jgi:ABC-2 type transport system permease protein
MRKIILIAVRDYLATVRTRSFLIGLLLLPILMAGGGAAVGVLSAFMVVHGDTEEKHFAVIDRTPGEKLYPHLAEAARRRNDVQIIHKYTGARIRSPFILERIEPSADNPDAINQQRYDLSERVTKGELFGFLEIGPDVCNVKPNDDLPPLPSMPAGQAPFKNLEKAVLQPPSPNDRAYLRYQTERITFQEFPLWADEVTNRAILRQRWLDAGMDAAKLPSLNPVSLQTEGLTRRDETGALREAPLAQQLAGHLVPAGVVFLMFMSVMIGTGPAMQNVVEEKMQRISEMLLGSVDPFQLMMGKLLGLTCVSLTISIVYLGAAFVGGLLSGLIEFLPVPVLIWFLPYQILAMMMYGSLSLAIGAAAKDVKGTQPYIFPVALLATMPMLFLVPVMQHPNGGFATALSFFPFAAPMLMTARLAVPPGVPWWQPILAIIPMAATTLCCVYIAGRVFRIGILLQGKGASVSDLMRWVVSG